MTRQTRAPTFRAMRTQPPDAGTGPLVSIIIPAYNRAHLIGRAIGSAFAQTYANFEIIVVDDASTDDLASALAAFSDPRLRCIVHLQNRGAAAARNTGVTASVGEFVAFLDSDDLWYPEKLARQVTAMRGQPGEVAGHVCAYECVKPGYPARHIIPDWTPDTFRRSQLFGCTCGPGTTLFCRRDIFAAIGPFDEELRRLEDWDWLLRLGERGYRLIGSPEVLAWVEVGSSPSPRAVDAAVASIQARHAAAVAREGARARRIFAATLYLERAAAAFGQRNYAGALADIARSVACYPLRGGGFYRRLVQRAAGAAGLWRAL